MQNIHSRRFPLVDVERGVIKRVEMIGPSAPYHVNSPWGGLSGD